MLGEAPLAIKTGSPIPKDTTTRKFQELLDSPEIQRVPFPLIQIQRFLESEIGARLPVQLIHQLGFPELDWQLVYHGASLPLLFVGAREHEDVQIPISGAMGTIHIERQTRETDSPVFVSRIRVAGVGQDSNGLARVQAVTYSPSGRRNASDIDVSVSELEFPSVPIDKPEWFDYVVAVVAIPTSASHPYIMAGLVTPAMVAALDANQQSNPKVVRFWDATSLGDRVIPLDFGHLTGKLGFTLKSPPIVNHVVSYKPPKGSDSSLKPWEVKFPRSLL